MRASLLCALTLAIALLLYSCSSVGLTGGPSKLRAWVCTQCNLACTAGKHCPACKGGLQDTDVAKACPRCGMACGKSCPLCGVRSVPAIQYYKCPACGKTLPTKGGELRGGNVPRILPACPGCGRKMLPQSVPLRACCPDCGVWSSRTGPCPRCGLDMSPM